MAARRAHSIRMDVVSSSVCAGVAISLWGMTCRPAATGQYIYQLTDPANLFLHAFRPPPLLSEFIHGFEHSPSIIPSTSAVMSSLEQSHRNHPTTQRQSQRRHRDADAPRSFRAVELRLEPRRKVPLEVYPGVRC